jgi:hypothetical protein
MSFTITRDHVDSIPTPHTVTKMPLYGIERAMGEDDTLPGSRRQVGAVGVHFLVDFKMYDDDGELCYEGTLDDDDECVNQIAALRWGESMAGCTTIEVNRPDKNPGDGRWTQEIG